MVHQIVDKASWELGRSVGMKIGLAKFVELFFEHLCSTYTEKLHEITDLDLIEQMHITIYSNNRSRLGLDQMLSKIDQFREKQTERNVVKENESSDEDWD